ncbi:MAG: glycosyltransferase [Terriglobales bacterium]
MSTPAILHVEVGGAYGGSLRALALYLRHCDRRRLEHDVAFYYPTPGMESLRLWVRQLEVLHPAAAPQPAAVRWPWSARRPHLPFEPAFALARQGKLVRQLRALIEKGGYAAVHCNNSFPYQAPTLLAARRAGRPVAAHVRNPLRGGAFERWLGRQVNLALVLHRGQAEQLQSWGLNLALAHCPDGVELPQPNPARVARWRRLAPPGGILVGALGRLTEQKGFLDLVAAAAAVLREWPQVRLVLFGDGEQRPALQAAIARQGLASRVVLAGFVDDAASALAALDLLVCSSHWEGVPLVVLEAMLAGVPVVATARALAGEPRLEPWLAAPPASADAASLAFACAHALLHLQHARARTAAARAWVAAEFAPAAAAARQDGWLEQLAHGDVRAREFYETAYLRPSWSRAGGAPSRGARFQKVWYRTAERLLLPQLQLAQRRVLEIGAGYGYLAPYFAGRGAAYVGLDLAANALRQFPRHRDGCAPVRGDACRLPFRAGAFDLVVCMEVWEHIQDHRALLEEIQRVAAPRACLLLSTPSYCNLFLPIKLLADAGWRAARAYLVRQPVDHTQFAFRIRRHLQASGEILVQRAVRLHPPLLERLDYRFGAGRGPARINDWLFALERRWGARFPWRHCGLHVCFLVRLRPAPAPQAVAAAGCPSIHSLELQR